MKVELRKIDAWLFPPAPPERLASLRVLVGSFALLYVVIRARVFLSLADAHASRFEPLGVLSWMSSPVPDAVLIISYAVAVAAGIAFVTGSWFRVSGPLFSLALLGLTTYRSSWGQILWLENLMVIQVVIVGFARSADALTWHRSDSVDSDAYGFPMRLAALVTVVTYLVAAVAKFRLGGIEWITSDSLRNHVAASVVRADLLGAASSPVGRWIVSYGWIFPPMAAASVLLELASPLALLGGRVRDAWVVLTWVMHASIALFMYVVFPYPLFLIAFAPFYDLEHLTGAASRLAGRRRTAGHAGSSDASRSRA